MFESLIFVKNTDIKILGRPFDQQINLDIWNTSTCKFLGRPFDLQSIKLFIV